VIKVEPGLPHVELSSAVIKRIKAVVVKRYNDNSKALDFSRFHTDPCERMVMYNAHTDAYPRSRDSAVGIATGYGLDD
jgi:hypothetical protein